MERNRIEAFAGKARNLLKRQIAARITILQNSASSQYVIENASAMATLNKKLDENGVDEVVDEVAYTWFNRLCAIRYMDARDFNRPLIVTPLEGNVLPEILFDAMTGLLDETILSRQQKDRIDKLLSGEIKSTNAQAEIYRVLLVAKCNALNANIPMLFEKLSSYTDLLLPEDLLSKDAIIPMMREALTDENCETVEVIGWLYQYYISERKDEVFASFKKGKKATAKEIPAATQLFTPEWIVRYLVENSLGRLWMLNHPESKLIEKMEYYIKPVDIEPDFLKISSPEEIKLCDPCCGSGHMLTYSFDILFEIYTERGYTSKNAVASIIKNNLYGIEIDDRASQLTYFALMMKAREKARRFFSLGIEPNVCGLHNIVFDEDDLRVACGLFSNTRDAIVKSLLTQFEHADTFGSLIVPCVNDIEKLKNTLTKTPRTDDLFSPVGNLEPKIREVLKYADFLSSKYHIVVTNPPYLSKLDDFTKIFAKKNYPDSKDDMCTMFMERNWVLTKSHGYSAMVNMQSWMTLSSFADLRKKILDNSTCISMCHIGTRGFDSIGGDIVSTTAFVTTNNFVFGFKTDYYRLVEGQNEQDKSNQLKLGMINRTNHYYVDCSIFKKIDNNPIAYWISSGIMNAYLQGVPVSSFIDTFQGIITGNNEKFLRFWHEVECARIPFHAVSMNSINLNNQYWIPYNKGGDFRKWYGIQDYVINWKNGPDDKTRGKKAFSNYYLREYVSWSYTVSNTIATRIYPLGFLWDVRGSGIMDKSNMLLYLEGLISSKVGMALFKVSNTTVSCQVENIAQLPVLVDNSLKRKIENIVKENNTESKEEWNSFEISWDFICHPLAISSSERKRHQFTESQMDDSEKAVFLISDRFSRWERVCLDRFNKLKANEEELNRIFIDIYGLNEELTPGEDDSDVTVRKADINRDIRSFVSYAVGCMFGRYSLDVDGLAYAGGAWNISKYTSFIPDEDNVIPVLGDEWFRDDIAARFKEFVNSVYGEETLSQNMKFIEDSLGMSIRSYFSKEFCNDHLKVYQKRPIYWMFSSPNGYFNALVYLHRYNENTISVVLKYLRELRSRISTEISALERENRSSSAKKLINYRKMAEDMDVYEQILYPIAMNHIPLDLDDGVKVNYDKLGKALKLVKGLNDGE